MVIIVYEDNFTTWIGVPKRERRDERRVALRTDRVAILVKDGDEGYVEIGVGRASVLTVVSSEQAGAQIVNLIALYDSARLMIKNSVILIDVQKDWR